MKKRSILRVLTVVLVIGIAFTAVFAGSLFLASYYGLLPEKTFSADYFGISTLKSSVDYNGNGIDDYTDILLGAKKEAENRPKYDGRYWPGGYPPDDIGVCTDVVWRAFREAGYSLKDMVDRDIKNRPEAYTRVNVPDENIDFRRVYNLRIFFEEYAEQLTEDINDIEQWQPGDIVFFKDDKHMGIVSDKRNSDGIPYVIHNGGQPKYEEDYLTRGKITGHYRFNAELVSTDVLATF